MTNNARFKLKRKKKPTGLKPNEQPKESLCDSLEPDLNRRAPFPVRAELAALPLYVLHLAAV